VQHEIAPIPLSGKRGAAQKADQDIQAQVFLAEVLDVLAFHDFDAAVAGREGVTVFGDPGGGDEYALGGVLVFHDPGQCADGLDADGVAVALGLDDAHAAEDGVVVDRDGVDAVVLDCLRVPGLHAHFLENLADEVLELVGGHRKEVRAAVQPGNDVHPGDELEPGQQGVEVHGGLHGLQVVGVR
jgi:hypothetical protein